MQNLSWGLCHQPRCRVAINKFLLRMSLQFKITELGRKSSSGTGESSWCSREQDWTPKIPTEVESTTSRAQLCLCEIQICSVETRSTRSNSKWVLYWMFLHTFTLVGAVLFIIGSTWKEAEQRDSSYYHEQMWDNQIPWGALLPLANVHITELQKGWWISSRTEQSSAKEISQKIRPQRSDWVTTASKEQVC